VETWQEDLNMFPNFHTPPKMAKEHKYIPTSIPGDAEIYPKTEPKQHFRSRALHSLVIEFLSMLCYVSM
jgi:hypothetical protein